MEIYIVFLVILALVFDFINGFHDSANSIATVISTRVLSPRNALILAAVCNCVAIFFFGLHVAGTIGKGIVEISVIDSNVIFATLLGAIIWNLITWFFGIPSSSSHALMGGLIGSALIKVGNTSVLVWSGILKTVAFIFISPVLGMVLGLLIGGIVYWLFHKASPLQVDNIFRKGQLISAAFYSIGHGGNDAQKTMGIIASLLFSAGFLGKTFYIPYWVIIACYISLGLGTIFGGWRIIKTLGQKVVKLRPVDGFCAELGAAATISMSTFLGIPVSTTQTITGAIMGIGTLRSLKSVRWSVAGQIAWAWLLTIPCSALLSAGAYGLISQLNLIKLFHG
jgi:PiT family inorganic phosphate transporter